jgi:uncharacterized repeat protein (TIGR03943 family)
LRNAQWIGTRWLGVGLAAALAVVTISLALTGRLGLYINPDSTWFAVSMAVLVLAGAIASFTLPLGAEAEHGHDHGDASAPAAAAAESGAASARAFAAASESGAAPESGGASESGAPGLYGRRIARMSEHSGENLRRRRETPTAARDDAAGHDAAGHDAAGHDAAGHEAARPDATRHSHGHHQSRHPMAVLATAAGGIAASGVVVLTLVLPPASLSAELAMSRDVGATPLFGGADVVRLAASGDTSSFGVGDWATAFATATGPDVFEGDEVELTGFVTPGDGDAFDLTRMVITHCVIDAQPASVPIVGPERGPQTGQWVTVTGTVRSTSDGRLAIDASSVEEIAEPEDPYEY